MESSVIIAVLAVIALLGCLLLNKLQPYSIDNIDAGAAVMGFFTLWFKGRSKGEEDNSTHSKPKGGNDEAPH